MPVQLGHTFGGFRCLNPAMLRRYSAKVSRIYDERANSYRCPTGFAYGTGWCLLIGKDAAEIESGRPYPFVLKAGEETFTLANAWVLRLICVTPSVESDKRAYLVEFVDRRYFYARFSSVTKGYNVRCPGTSHGLSTVTDFYQGSLKPDEFDPEIWTVWTWEGILEDLLDNLGISYSNEFTTSYPTAGPENLQFIGVRTWEALEFVCTRIGATILFDPEEDTYRIVAVSSSDIDSSTLNELAKRLVFDFDTVESPLINIPQYFDVHFRRVEQHAGCEPDMHRLNQYYDEDLAEWVETAALSWWTGSAYVKRVESVSTGSFGFTPIAGTVEPIWSHIPYLRKPNGDPITLVDSDAEELVQLTIRNRIGDSLSQKKVYGGLPSSVVSHVAYRTIIRRDYGDDLGTVTETVRHAGNGSQESAYASLARLNKGGQAASGWAWSAMSSFGGFTGSLPSLSSPVLESVAPPDFARHTMPSYPRGMSILAYGELPVDPETEETDFDRLDGAKTFSPIVAEDFAKKTGRILFLDPSDMEALEWNSFHDRYEGQECWITFPGLDETLVTSINFPVGQTFFGRLQGVDPDGIPIFVVHYHVDFVTGFLKTGETLCPGGTAIAIGGDGLEYQISGKFLSITEGKGYNATDAVFLGWHADPYDTSEEGIHYWKLIVASECPTAVDCEE